MGTIRNCQFRTWVLILKTFLVGRDRNPAQPALCNLKIFIAWRTIAPYHRLKHRQWDRLPFYLLALLSLGFTLFSGRLSSLWKQNGCEHLKLISYLYNPPVPAPPLPPNKEEFCLPDSSRNTLELVLNDFTPHPHPWTSCSEHGMARSEYSGLGRESGDSFPAAQAPRREKGICQSECYYKKE